MFGYVIDRIYFSSKAAGTCHINLDIVNRKVADTQTFVRAAEKNGYTARIVQRPLKKLSKLLLPAGLILDDGAACVLTDFPDRKSATVMFPEAGFGTTKLELAALDKQFSGYVIFVQPEFGLDDSRLGNVGPRSTKAWFWGTLWRYRRYYAEAILAAGVVNLLTVATSLFIRTVLMIQSLGVTWVQTGGVAVMSAV